MKSKHFTYWICQLSGWAFYGLAMLFFRFVNTHNNLQQAAQDKNFTGIINKRLAIAILFGLLFTHFMRFVILQLKLHPPIAKKKWFYIIGIAVITSYLYSVTNSAIVEWFQWYNPSKKVSLQQRSLYNFLNDVPIIFVWTSIYYMWHYVQISTRNEVDKIRLESLVKDLELKTIKSHINPHFIFNALNSIRALVDENPARARTAITELSNILRSSMQVEKIEMVPLERELNIVKDYLALEYIRFEERLQVAYYIDDDTLDYGVPPMMLQTLVENAIKHGISTQLLGGLITIQSSINGNNLILTVKNSGKLQSTHNPDGFGISGTENRLNLLYGKKAVFELKELPNQIVEAKIIIPF